MMLDPKSEEVETKTTDNAPEAIPSTDAYVKPPPKNPCPDCESGLGRDPEEIHYFLCMNQSCKLFVNRFDNYKIKLRKK